MKQLYLPFLICCFVCASSAVEDLEQSVHRYWDALIAQDKVAALPFVHPDDLNNFLYRSESLIYGWKLDHVNLISDSEASVLVSVTRQFKLGFVKEIKIRNLWNKTDQGWRVRIPAKADAFLKVYQHASEEAKIPSRLDLVPKTLKFYAISPHQPGVIYVRNGLQLAAQLLGLEFDSKRFELIDSIDQVAPVSIAKIRLRFIGYEKEENLKSKVTLRIRQGEETHEYVVPIIYNYMDDVLRWAEKKIKKKP